MSSSPRPHDRCGEVITLILESCKIEVVRGRKAINEDRSANKRTITGRIRSSREDWHFQRCGNSNCSKESGELGTGEKHAVDLETDEDVPTWSDIHTPLNFSACRDCLCAMQRASLTPQCGSNGLCFGPESSWQKSFRKRTTGSRRWTSAHWCRTRAGNWTWSCSAGLRMASSRTSDTLERSWCSSRTVNSARGSSCWRWTGWPCLDYRFMTFLLWLNAATVPSGWEVCAKVRRVHACACERWG